MRPSWRGLIIGVVISILKDEWHPSDAHSETETLFTDIVMPDVNGRQLAAEVLRRYPNIKVLYTTGFTRNAIVHSGKLDAGLHFIAKPFTLVQIAAKMTEVLDISKEFFHRVAQAIRLAIHV